MIKKAAAAILLIALILWTGPAYAAGSFSAADNEITLTIGESTVLTGVEEGALLASSDETTVSVSGNTITGLQTGSCNITVTMPDGRKHNIRVNVNPVASRRALVLGEADYGDEPYRTGSVNTTQGIADMLGSQKFGGAKYEVTMRMDSSRAEVFRLIETAFAGADEYSVSLIYVNCHGGVSGGVPYLRFHDNTRICAPELESALRRIPGVIIVMLDCCQSGAFLGDREGARKFLVQFVNAFCAFGSGGVFLSNKYKVLASCAYCQNSYRITTEKTVTETGMSTVFARALCEGAGWDLIRDKVCTMKADADLDRRVGLTEMYTYLRRRVPHYLTAAGVNQDTVMYPEGDGFILFER